MEFIKKIKNVFKDEKYRKNPVPESLTKEKRAALNIGAIISEKNMYYCDSLTTGINSKNLTKYLFEYFEITSMISAKRTLQWLLNRGHRAVFYHMTDKDHYVSDYERGLCTIFMENLDDVSSMLIKNGYVKEKNEIYKTNITPWDMARLVIVARSCYDCGYITKEEAWDYIDKAYMKVVDKVNNWKDFANMYIIAKSVIYGENVDLQVDMEIAKDLLNDSESPWNKNFLK